MSRRSLFFLAAFLLSAPLAAAPAPGASTPGWSRFELPETGSYFWRYVPQGLDLSVPAPALVFLHGSGGIPDNYRIFLEAGADLTGRVVILPKSSTEEGWGTAEDGLILDESLRTVRAELTLDPHRVAIGGHSAGGAWAYQLAYTTRSGFSAVFSMAARFYEIDAVADPSYKAPIRMYYGTLDPNYTGGSEAALKSQWERLGIPWEEEILPGYGHNNLPSGAVRNGFLFLADKVHPTGIDGGTAGGPCVPGPATLCLEDGRFRVEVTWRDFQGNAGHGSVVPGAAADSGLFWFFGPDNWEMLVKVLDGCAVNGHHWVFAAATTTVEWTLTVTDTHTGESATWTNPLGRASPAITGTDALGGCS